MVRRGSSPLLLFNGSIHTMDEDSPSAQAVLAESGTVKGIGTTEELGHSYSAERLDLHGLSVFPGFIDSHVHLLSYGLSLDEMDLSDAECIEDVLVMVREAPDRGRVIRACQLDPDSLREGRYPTRCELDSLGREEAVFLKRRDEHSSVLNTKAFELLSLSPGTPGIDVDPSTGEPTGVLRKQANQLALETFHGMIDSKEMEEAYVRGSQAALELGVTTVHSLVGSDENPERRDCEALVDMMDNLPTRVIPYCQTRDIDRVLSLGLDRIGGCILIDGSIGSRTAAFGADYEDDPGNDGCLYMEEDELFFFFEAAQEKGLQIAVHAIGDRAVERALVSYERLLGERGAEDRRHRIEHAEYVTEGQFERIARLGLRLGMQPAFEGFWGGEGGMYEKRLGAERARNLNRLTRALSCGIPVAGGSDAPITPPDPVYGVHWAVNHPTPESRVSVGDAVRIFTRGGAEIAHREDELGILKPGWCADLVGLSQDPFRVRREEIKEIEVLLVVLAGEVVLNRLPKSWQGKGMQGA